MSKKYELTDETMEWEGHTLHRIKALRDFNDVKAGDLGGWVESEDNLSQYEKCWLYGNARVYGDARIYGNAIVCGDAIVHDNARVCDNAIVCNNARIYNTKDYCIITGFGSRLSATTFFRCKDDEIRVNCGCFNGTLDEFRDKVKETHKDNKYAKEYLLAIDMVKVHFS